MAPSAHHPSIILSAVIALLIAWRLYARVRRMVGRQRLSKVRPWFTVCVFPILLVVLLLTSIGLPLNTMAIAGGIAIGIGLGLYGLRLTTFEQTPDGLFYTPSAHLGIGLSAVFIGRIAYRLMQGSFAAGTAAPMHTDLTHSPLTLLIFATLSAYYVTYAAGLLRWRGRIGVTVEQVANQPTM